MPLTTTHALVPIAFSLAFVKKPVPWRLILVAAIASGAPDVDGLTNPVWNDTWGLSTYSIYAHRGAAHSLSLAIVVGLIAALCSKRLRVRPLVGGVAVAAAMASHGILDMMTDLGRPVAYLWPLSSVRLFADWRPIHSSPVPWSHFLAEVIARQISELCQIIIPMFVVAIAIRGARASMLKGRQLDRSAL